VSQHGYCKVCKEELNLYGGCRCNGYTTAFKVESPATDTQQANTAIALLKKWRDCANDDLWRETMLFLAQIAQQR